MANDSLERLIALVRRELGAESVRVLEAEDEEALADNVLYARLPDGRRLAVAFASAPPAKEVLVRRLSMLTATFAHSLEVGPRGASRPTLTRSLQDELRALAARARARDAAVIDAHSPVVWGAASAEPESAPPDKIALVDVSSTRLMPSSPPSELDTGEANEVTKESPSFDGARELTERAIDTVRDLPGIDALRKGGHVAHTERGTGPDDMGIFTRSFASIYLLVLVFEGPFDEL